MKKQIARILLIVLIAITGAFIITTATGIIHIGNNGIYSANSSSFPTASKSSSVVKVACVGDSITYGDKLDDPANQAYPAQLQKLLGKKYEVMNYGYGGTAVQKNSQSPYWDKDVYTSSQNYKPDVVFIMLGTNDTWEFNWHDADSVLTDYKSLVESYANLDSKPCIILMTEPKMFSDYKDFNDRLIKINAAVKNYAHESGYQLIDIYNITKKHPEFFTTDGVHPDADGAKFIAEYIYSSVKH